MAEIKWNNVSGSDMNTAVGHVQNADNALYSRVRDLAKEGQSLLNDMNQNDLNHLEGIKDINTQQVINQMHNANSMEDIENNQELADAKNLLNEYGNRIDLSKINQTKASWVADTYQRATARDNLRDTTPAAQKRKQEVYALLNAGKQREAEQLIAQSSGLLSNSMINSLIKDARDWHVKDREHALNVLKTQSDIEQSKANANLANANARRIDTESNIILADRANNDVSKQNELDKQTLAIEEAFKQKNNQILVKHKENLNLLLRTLKGEKQTEDIQKTIAILEQALNSDNIQQIADVFNTITLPSKADKQGNITKIGSSYLEEAKAILSEFSQNQNEYDAGLAQLALSQQSLSQQVDNNQKVVNGVSYSQSDSNSASGSVFGSNNGTGTGESNTTKTVKVDANVNQTTNGKDLSSNINTEKTTTKSVTSDNTTSSQEALQTSSEAIEAQKQLAQQLGLQNSDDLEKVKQYVQDNLANNKGSVFNYGSPNQNLTEKLKEIESNRATVNQQDNSNTDINSSFGKTVNSSQAEILQEQGITPEQFENMSLSERGELLYEINKEIAVRTGANKEVSKETDSTKPIKIERDRDGSLKTSVSNYIETESTKRDYLLSGDIQPTRMTGVERNKAVQQLDSYVVNSEGKSPLLGEIDASEKTALAKIDASDAPIYEKQAQKMLVQDMYTGFRNVQSSKDFQDWMENNPSTDEKLKKGYEERFAKGEMTLQDVRDYMQYKIAKSGKEAIADMLSTSIASLTGNTGKQAVIDDTIEKLFGIDLSKVTKNVTIADPISNKESDTNVRTALEFYAKDSDGILEKIEKAYDFWGDYSSSYLRDFNKNLEESNLDETTKNILRVSAYELTKQLSNELIKDSKPAFDKDTAKSKFKAYETSLKQLSTFFDLTTISGDQLENTIERFQKNKASLQDQLNDPNLSIQLGKEYSQSEEQSFSKFTKAKFNSLTTNSSIAYKFQLDPANKALFKELNLNAKAGLNELDSYIKVVKESIQSTGDPRMARAVYNDNNLNEKHKEAKASLANKLPIKALNSLKDLLEIEEAGKEHGENLLTDELKRDKESLQKLLKTIASNFPNFKKLGELYTSEQIQDYIKQYGE